MRVADGALPPRTIALDMQLTMDGQRVPIPRRFFADLPDPGDLEVHLADDFRSVFVSMTGGEGGEAYHVIWNLRPDGRHTRAVLDYLQLI